MKRNSLALIGALAASVLLLAGCETTQLPDQAALVPVETRSPGANAGTGAAGGATASGMPASRVATVDLDKDAAARAAAAAAAASMTLPNQKVVYFDFDSYAIKDDFKPLIDGYAKALQANRRGHLVVEGHTDERGGSEYNLALGQKRAEAVVRSLTLLGVGQDQLEAVSFGEERPALQGTDEAAWSKNRRAELKDR